MVKFLCRGLLALAITAMMLWCVGVLFYSPLLPESWRAPAAGLFAVLVLLAFLFLPRRGRTAIAAAAIFVAMVVAFLRIPASNDRDWQPEVRRPAYATIQGSMVTIHNVRNFDYKTETDFTERWDTRTYDLNKLDSANIIAVYWAGKAIAHIMISFGFGDKDYLAVSIETRKEKGESYSTLAGFFRQYELYYVVADERDVIRVRTTYRQPQEDVYVYRVNGPVGNVRRVFLDYIQSMNELHRRPGYYNTLTTNCTTSILFHSRMNPEAPPMSWKILLSGYVPDYLYELGRLDTSKPFPELEKLSHVNARAHAADKDPAFSQRIREGLPKPAPLP
jgi:hypothetical protein